MKKLLAIVAILAISGCAAAIKESEFGKHDSVYKDMSHLWFSWCGYRDVDRNDVNKSNARGWWGIAVPYRPDDARGTGKP
ncbi:MAG: hypothetical protein QM278_03290 [Pseudomonadota bacterium]|nr:hypothetical protein [Pseudomonadota bacterium]